VTDSAETDTATIAWFQPFSGIAGDMALGALLDAGADLGYVISTLEGLGITGWSLDSERTQRHSLAATRALVDAPEQHHHRKWRDISELLKDSDLPDRVRDRAHRIFEALAIAEAHVHGVGPDEVHFHEVGALDAIVDIVGCCAALESLGIDIVASAPVAVGTGTITAAHGVLPNPPPAVVRLLEGVPTTGIDIGLELTTPTGAAIVAALAETVGPMPSMTIRSSGFGAGTRDIPDRANVTHVVIGSARSSEVVSGNTNIEELTELSTNIDDITGELLAHAISELLSAGALDVWAIPIVMKKGRPAHSLNILARQEMVAELTELLFGLTGTLGVRATTVQRTFQPRSVVEVDVDGQKISVKVGPARVKAEFDDVASAARTLGRSPADVAAAAEALARHQVDN
jgi:uncharacterized protein (TIGR00299 family) protein